jgi:ATP-binding cassette subfamily B protein
MRRDALVQGSALAVYLGAFAYGVLLARDGELAAGGVVALAAGVRAAQQAAEEISYQMSDAHGHALHLLSATAVLRRARAAPGAPPPLRARDTLTWRGIRYRYPGARRDALRGATLRLRRGHPLALVGENGSGKTTLALILLGLLPPCAGSVEGDGGEPLRRSAVLQDHVRYGLTLRENVGLGDVAHLDDAAAVRGALAAAAGPLDPALAGLDLETPLGAAEGGAGLSGGQWLAVAGARGLFAKGELLVLDEPTAALDPLAERALLAHFARLARDRFAVIITHRMGVAALVDEVAVMRRGRVVEAGPPAALLAAGGPFARMWEAQARWYR